MKMGEDTVEGTKQMFAVRLCFLAVLHGLTSVQELEEKVSLSLNAWTSPNLIAFLTIVVHYVTNDGQLGRYYTVLAALC